MGNHGGTPLMNKAKEFLKTKITGPLVGLVMAIAFAALAFVVAGLVLSYGAKINSDVGTGLTGTASLVNLNVSAGLNTFGSNMPTVASVIVAVIIIALLFLGFGSLLTGRGKGGV